MTPLHIAVKFNDFQMVNFLISNYAIEINEKYVYKKMTILMWFKQD